MFKPIACCLLALGMLGVAAAAEQRHVAVTQIVEHPSLDAIRQGLIDELADQGLKQGETLRLDYQSAQGNPATAAQIARQFIGDGPDLIVAIATPSAQAVAAATRDLPVLFSAVTDPVAARLVADPEHPGGNITGVSDYPPIAEQLGLILEIAPALQTLGVIYNPGETNSVSMVETLERAAGERGVTVIESAATRSSEVLGAARALVGRAEAVYVPLDNTVVSALEAVIRVGREARLPVYSADTDSVGRGTVASLGFDYYTVGRQTGRLALRILNGEKPGDIPVQRVEALNLFLNLEAAGAMGVQLPAALIDRAVNLSH